MIRTRLLDLDHKIAMAIDWAARTLGFRGAFLALLSLLDLVWAWRLINPPTAKTLKVAPTARVLVGIAPLWVWGLLIGLIGVLCGVQAWQRDDKWAFGAAISWMFMWAAATLATWPTAGVAVIPATIIYLVLGGIVLVCAAGLPFREE